MPRHKQIQSPETDEPNLDISSLIDVCFLLLIYFIVTSQIVKKEQELTSTLPVIAHTLSHPALPPLFLIVAENGHISLKGETGYTELLESNSHERELPFLLTRLKSHRDLANAVSQPPLVRIQVDANTIQQRVIDVLNTLAKAQITEVTFTDPPLHKTG